MAIDPVSAVSAGAGLIGAVTGKGRQRAADNANNQMLSMEMEKHQEFMKMLERMFSLNSEIDDRFTQMQNEGLYDPEVVVEKVRRRGNEEAGIMLENLAGAHRVMGGKPGDTVPQQEAVQVATNQQQNLDDKEIQIREQYRDAEMNALMQQFGRGAQLAGLAAGIPTASPALESARNYNQSQVPDMAQMAYAFMPLFQNTANENQPVASGTVQSTGSKVGGYAKRFATSGGG